jgi:hypothetical protein
MSDTAIERASPRVKALFESKASALTRTRGALAKVSSPVGVFTASMWTLGGTAAAGVLDARIAPLPLGPGIKPSVAAGIAAGVVAIPAGSPTLARIAVGMLSPSVYEYAYNASVKK